MGRKNSLIEKKETASENIRVVVRSRPLNPKELECNYKECVELNLAESNVTVHHLCGAPDRWTFDAVVNNTFTQRDIFMQYIQPLVDSVLDGFNATVFAYGQSGSGKTYTMTGDYDDSELMGIIPRVFAYIFGYIKQAAQTTPNKRYSLYCSMVELYLGKVRDLLARQQVPLAVKESKDKTFYVAGANIPQVKFPEDLTRLMEEGTDRRKTGSTELNADSSRSHSIFALIVECTTVSDDGDTSSVTSKLNLVDLAGSERQSKTAATGETLKEGCNINLSLSALGTVIDTIVKGRGHIPFRSSPLTMLLKDSLGGSSKTVMFANIGPSEHNLSETVSTLRFADRAKQIKNKPVINIDTKDQKIAELTELVNELKTKLKQIESGGMHDMEVELEDLRRRCGELEIDHDNAVQGREADAVDFQNAKMHLESRIQQLSSDKEELSEQLNRRSDEVKLAEDIAKDEQHQRREILSTCARHFDCHIDGIDDVIHHLRELSNAKGVPEDEHAKLQAQNSEIAAELRNLKEIHIAESSQLTASVERLQEELSQSSKRIEKLRHSLDKEKHARKQILETQKDISPIRTASFNLQQSVSMSAIRDSSLNVQQMQDLERRYESEIEELRAEVAQLEQERDGNSRVKELEAQLEHLSKEKAATIASLMEELQQTNDIVESLKSSEGDTVSVAHLKTLLKTKSHSVDRCREEIHSLEKIVSTSDKIRHERRPSYTTFDMQRDAVGAVQRQHLRQEVDEAFAHRDELLAQVLAYAASDSATHEQIEIASHLKQLQTENAALRDRLRDYDAKAAQHESEQMQESHSSARISELEDIITKLHRKGPADDKALKTLQRENEELRDKMDDVIQDCASREKKMIQTLGSSGSDEEENPMQTVVEMLHSDKTLLTNEVARLSRELRTAQNDLDSATALVSSSTSLAAMKEKEVERLRDLVTKPRMSDSEELASLRAELREANDRKQQQQPNVSGETEASQMQLASQDKSRFVTQQEFEAMENELRAKMSAVEMECSTLRSELENTAGELEYEVSRRETIQAENHKVLADSAALRQEMHAAKEEAAQLASKLSEERLEMARVLHDGDDAKSLVEQLEARVQERAEQLKDLRSTLEKQKSMIDKLKARLETQQQALNAAKQDVIAKDQQHQVALREQEAHILVIMNKKIALLSEEHQLALQRKDEQAYALRKKIKKIEAQVEKAKAKYDEKVCEYEELATRMEEQKLDMLRMMKESSVAQIEETQDQIRDALQAKKEAQRRRMDMFEMGEVTSALAELRAAGTATNLVARAHGKQRAKPPWAVSPSTQDIPLKSPTVPTKDTFEEFE